MGDERAKEEKDAEEDDDKEGEEGEEEVEDNNKNDNCRILDNYTFFVGTCTQKENEEIHNQACVICMIPAKYEDLTCNVGIDHSSFEISFKYSKLQSFDLIDKFLNIKDKSYDPLGIAIRNAVGMKTENESFGRTLIAIDLPFQVSTDPSQIRTGKFPDDGSNYVICLLNRLEIAKPLIPEEIS